MAKLLASPTKNAIQKTLASQLLSSAGSTDPITFDDVDGLPNLPGVLVINRVDDSGVATPTKREYIEYSGTSGTTVLITTRNVDGSTSALTHAVGSIVEFIPDVTWADRIYDALATIIDVDNNTSIKSGLVLTTPTISLGVMSSSGATISAILDEDDMASDSSLSLATQQSIKAYVDPSVSSEASNATPAPVGDNKINEHYITALAAAALFSAPSGTPANGNILRVRVLDNGTARALTWNAIYRAVGPDLPTTTTISKTLYIGFIYNSADTKWDCVATAEEA